MTILADGGAYGVLAVRSGSYERCALLRSFAQCSEGSEHEILRCQWAITAATWHFGKAGAGGLIDSFQRTQSRHWPMVLVSLADASTSINAAIELPCVTVLSCFCLVNPAYAWELK